MQSSAPPRHLGGFLLSRTAGPGAVAPPAPVRRGGRGGDRGRFSKVFEGFRRFSEAFGGFFQRLSEVFGGFRWLPEVPGGSPEAPRGSQKSPEIFDFS